MYIPCTNTIREPHEKQTDVISNVPEEDAGAAPENKNTVPGTVRGGVRPKQGRDGNAEGRGEPKDSAARGVMEGRKDGGRV